MKHEKKPQLSKAEAAASNLQSASADPQGSYTGVPENPYEKPVQDADDL